MSPRSDMLRPNGMAQPVLGMNGGFVPNPPQPGHANASNPHGPIGMLGSAPSNPNPANIGPRYPMSTPSGGLLPAGQQRPPMMMRQGQNPGAINPNIAGATTAGPPMGNLGMQGVNFPAGMSGAQGAPHVRRVSSQPHLNANGMAGRMGVGGMPQSVGNNMGHMGLGMNPQVGMPAQIRVQQQHHLQQLSGGHMSSEMAGSGMNRSGPNAGPGGGPGGNMGGGGGMGVGGTGGGAGPNIARTNPAMPLMHSLSQPTSSLTGPSGIGMPGGPHQNNFQNMSGMQHPHQHPPHQQHPTPQLSSSSPRPGSHHGGPTHAPNLSMGTPGPSQPHNRTTMTPDNNSSYPNFNGNGPQFPPGPGPGGAGNRVASGGMGGGMPIGDNGGNGGGNNAYTYLPSTPPNSNPNQMVVDSQSLPGSLGGTPSGTPNRLGFTLTPAQQLQMQGIDGGAGGAGFRPFAVGPNNVPPRPPSQSQPQLQHNVNHPFAPHTHPSHSSHPSHPSHPSQQTSLQHPSPHPNDLMNSIYPPIGSGPSPGRPQSQNQNHSHPGRSPSQAAASHTPRPGQAVLPPGMHPGPGPGRPPHGRPQSSNGMPGSNSGPSQLQNIAPRPPAGSAPGSSTGPHLPGHSNAIQPSASAPPMTGPSSHPGSHPSHLGPGPHPPSHPESSSPSSATPPGQPNPDSQPHGAIPSTISAGLSIPPGVVSGGHPTHTIPRAVQPATPSALGHGLGLIRLLQFSGNLASESKQKLQLSWWSELIREYFTPHSTMRFTLWKDNQKNEAKVFEIGVPILPRFFLVTTQSGVKSMTLTLDGARERVYSTGHAVVECVAAVWTYKYNNGYTVALRGPLTVHVLVTQAQPTLNAASNPTIPSGYVLKFDELQFDATLHDKYIALESIMGPRSMENKTPRMRNNLPPGAPGNAVIGPAGASTGMNGIGLNGSEDSQEQEDEKKWEEPRVMIERGFIPGEPVNAFGIPQATMRCLELAESVAQMTDLIAFSSEQNLGPLEALSKMATKIRESMPPNQQSQPLINGVTNPNVNFHAQPIPQSQSGFPSFSSNGSAPSTLYSSAPSSVTNPSSAQTPSTMVSTSSPQNTPSSANNSPRKQHKTIPQQSTGGSSSTAPGTSSNPASTTNTPAMSNASLKRKQVSESPASTNAEQHPPTKRTNRKRRTTGGER